MKTALISLLLLLATSGNAWADRIKDLASVAAGRTNQLIGYGLVVGLQGTGDGSDVSFTAQSMKSMLSRMGVSLDGPLSDFEQGTTAGKIDIKGEIKGEALVAAGVIRRVKDGVRVLGTGEIKAKLNLVVWSASAGAVKAIEAAGGTIVQERIAAEAKAAARIEKRNAAKGKAPPAKAPRGDANKISARTTRTAAKK
jgi:hypothetical protein